MKQPIKEVVFDIHHRVPANDALRFADLYREQWTRVTPVGIIDAEGHFDFVTPIYLNHKLQSLVNSKGETVLERPTK